MSSSTCIRPPLVLCRQLRKGGEPATSSQLGNPAVPAGQLGRRRRSGQAERLQGTPRTGGDLKVELDFGETEVMPGHLADALEAVLEGGAVDRQGPGGGVVVPGEVEVLAQWRSQQRSVLGIVAD